MLRFALPVVAIALACTLPPQPAFAGPQAADTHSNLVDKDGNKFSDDDFAKLMSGLLLKDGKANAKDAKFLFQQCFGGGMLDDLDSAFGAKLKWIGGSASAHDQVSFGGTDPTQPDAWTKALLPGITNKDPKKTLATDLANARRNDRAAVTQAKPVVGINPKTGKPNTPEDPQTITRNGGETITLPDADAKSHHAIIWTGMAEARHLADSAGVQDALNKQWGPDSKTVTRHVVNTVAGLKSVVEELKKVMNADEQFFFYSTDHGQLTTTMLPAPVKVSGGASDVEALAVSAGELEGMQLDAFNVASLTVQYSALSDYAPVSFNGVLLGQLDPSLTEMTFNIDESFIGLLNSVSIANLGSSDFMLEGKFFTGGAIATYVPIPEPSTWVLLCLGFAALGVRGARAKRRHQ